MKISMCVLCFIITTDIVYGHNYEALNRLIYVDKVDLSQLVTEIIGLKQRIEQCNSRLEGSPQNVVPIANDSSIFDIRVDAFPEKCKINAQPKSCAAATACTQRSGIYRILLEKYSSEPFLVECDVKTEGGGWTLIQRRQDGSEDFYRDWAEYQRGFGSIDGEFFIGLDKLHALTNYNGPQELLVLLEDKNETRKAFYNNFKIGGESESYILRHVGIFSGDAGDSLSHHMGAKFTTKDRDNDSYDGNCAQLYTGAWWYKACHISNLNGNYGDTNYAKGLTWQTYGGYNISVQHVTMMIRRRSF